MIQNYSCNLLSALRKNEYQKIYILSGERGIGKHRAMCEAEITLKESMEDITILSVHPDEFGFSLWPMEQALLQGTSEITPPKHETKNGLNYVEQLTRCFIDLCTAQSKVVIFLYHIHSFSDDLWAFTSKLFRLLLNPYRRSNVCFCCCLHTNSDPRTLAIAAYRSTDQLIELLARYPKNTHYLHVLPWPRSSLQEFLDVELFQGNLQMSQGQKDLILDVSMGNPATLVSLIERLKIRGVLYEKSGNYYCRNIDGSVLLTCGPVPSTEEYRRMDLPLQELLRGSSVIGVEFEAKLLDEPLKFTAVENKLQHILSLSRIIQRKVDDIYEFESMFARLSIRDLVSQEEAVLWNSRLGEYFWKLSQRQVSEGEVSAGLNSLKKSAFYFDEAQNRPQALQLYERLSMELMSIMQYNDAIKVIQRIRCLCTMVPDLRTPDYLSRTFQLEGDCFRYCSNFPKAIRAYRTFIQRAHLTKYELMDARCIYYTMRYESGEVMRPLSRLKSILSELRNETNPQAAPILVRTLSSLSSIEETLCDPTHEAHFNMALDIAKRYKITDEYYILLRKALIVHKGIYGIRLMESARKYFEETGNLKELAKTLCNIASELLLHGDLEQARNYYQHGAEILHSIGAETRYVPINGLGDYWCLRGNFERACTFFEEAYQPESDAFTRIAIRINQATAYRKLGDFCTAEKRLNQAENISKTGDASEYAILLPHLLIGKALLAYDKEKLDDAYSLFWEYIQDDPNFGRRRPTLAAQYIKKICTQQKCPLPEGIEELARVTSPADERLLQHGITLIRFSITE